MATMPSLTTRADSRTQVSSHLALPTIMAAAAFWTTLPLILCLAAMLACAVPAAAQKVDDSYKGPPPPGGGFSGQLRRMEGNPRPPPAAPREAAPRGGVNPGGGLRGTQTQGTIAPIPIAIPLFLSDDPQLGRAVADVVSNDLERSGLFRPLDRASFLEDVRDVNAAPRFPDWRQIRTDALAVGRVVRGSGQIIADFRLWDVVSGKQLAGQRFATTERNWRRVGHLIADRIYEQLTGEKGYFDTRVVFIDETGPKEQRVKRLAIMDQDGANVRLLTQGKEIVLTPRFSPTSQQVVFMSYTRDQPHVFSMNLETGQRAKVGEFPGMTFAPRFSPDGQRVVMSFQSGGNSSIYEMDLRTRQTRRLTNVQAIDTGPSYAPDGQQIVFESDRAGSQQLYVMNADGSGARRISFGDGRYSTPVWSPRGDYIAFTKQLAGRFLIGVMRPDGSGERILTEGYHNEGPTWAPNGRVLMFFRENRRGQARIYSIDLTGYNERVVPTPSGASDPAWSPLLN